MNFFKIPEHKSLFSFGFQRDSVKRYVRRLFITLFLIIGVAGGIPKVYAIEPSEREKAFGDPPGNYDVCWIGNTFSGSGGDNGFGYWVQNGADEIEVAPNGLVIAGCDWDEAGRCVGLYKDGNVNRVLLKQEGVPETAWGWNTGNHAVSIRGKNIYVANLGKHLIRFVGDPDDLDSWKPQDDAELCDEPVGINANDEYVAIAYKNKIELLSARDLKLIREWNADKDTEIQDVLLSESSDVWTIMDDSICLLTLDQKGFLRKQVGIFQSLEKPIGISFDAVERTVLIVCDGGHDKQVKFYDVANPSVPKLVKTFGEKNGAFSDTIVEGKHLSDGVDHPTRFYDLRGAGTDLQGNVYVALGFNGAPVGSFALRKFDKDGSMKWELLNLAFVDTFGFDPNCDGKQVYTRTSIIELNPDSSSPDLDWKRVATTIDSIRYSKEEDFRASSGATANIKTLQGRKLLYTIGQYGGGFQFFSFDEENDGKIARPVGKITADGETWAWCMDSNGDVWHGDNHQNRSIRRYRFKGWEEVENADVPNLFKPVYDIENYDERPWPEDFELVRRAIYDAENDVMYLTGYLKTDEIDSWGVCGKTIRRYDNWTSDKPTI